MLRKSIIYALATQIVPVSYAALDDLLTYYIVNKLKCKVVLNSLEAPKTSFNGYSKKITCLGRLLLNKSQDVFIKAADIGAT
ncbi:MAG: hypothetical protein M3512_16015 [Bacteroidota bacterium]|nr:hypothetical protein [Bacteroidota bacterium]